MREETFLLKISLLEKKCSTTSANYSKNARILCYTLIGDASLTCISAVGLMGLWLTVF